MTDKQEFLATLTEIFQSELDNESLQLKMTDTQDDIQGWDSLAHVRIIMRIEGAFGVQFEVEEIEHMLSVTAIYEALCRHTG